MFLEQIEIEGLVEVLRGRYNLARLIAPSTRFWILYLLDESWIIFYCFKIYVVAGQSPEVPTCMLGAIAEMRSQPEIGLQRKQFLGNDE